jgi:hypothetical protein
MDIYKHCIKPFDYKFSILLYFSSFKHSVCSTPAHKNLFTVDIILDTKWLLGSLIIIDYNRVVFLLNRRLCVNSLTAETCSGVCDKSICPGAFALGEMFFIIIHCGITEAHI